MIARRSHILSACLLVCSLGVLLGLGGLILGNHPETAIWESLFVTTLVLLIPLFIALLRRRIDIFEPIYLVALAYFLYFVYAPTIDVLNERYLFFGRDVRILLPIGILYAALGVLSMVVGYYAYRLPVLWLVRRLPTPGRPVSSARVKRYGWVLVGVTMVCFGTYVSAVPMSWVQLLTLGQVGGATTAISADATASPFQNYLKSTIECFVPAFMILYVFGRPKGKWIIAMFVLILVIYATLGFRYRILVLVLSPIVYRYLRLERRPSMLSLSIAAVASVLVLGGLGMLRTSFRSGSQIEVADLSIDRAQDSFTSSLSIYQPFVAVVDAIPAVHPYFGWRPFAYLLIQPIPRAIWPDKPDAPVRDIITAAFDERAARAGIFYPNIGEYYASFGAVGVIVGMVCFGAAMRVLYEYLLRHRDNEWARIVYAITLPFLVQIVSRGYFVQIVQEAVFLLGPVLLGMHLLDGKAPPRHRHHRGWARRVKAPGERVLPAAAIL